MATRRRGPELHVALLAGGSGTRFWPLSRRDRPKQFLSLAGGESLLARSWMRVRRLAPAERVWVVAPRKLRRAVRSALPELRADRLIVEPSPRDTGPAAGLACARVAKLDPTAVLALFPTDHVVRDERAFVRAVRGAAAAARQGALVCLGVRPDRPATGFGYLKCSADPVAGRAIPVERFVEKPDLARARRFLRTGKYLWNAGMFVWRVDRFLEELGRAAPEIHRAVGEVARGRAGAWEDATRLSVDYAVMERARNVAVVPLDAGWDDVGSWDAAVHLRRDVRGDDLRGRLLLDSADSAIFGGERFVALVDAPGIVVVDTPDALLIVGRGSSEKVRTVVERLREQGHEDLL
jgi:mannose-1-phosphate guanylyltransferase/mannose-6-phosphate isomerase